ncbi:hypothetical protein [Acuticoccus sp.]|uniref:hypothetical protein n=1 Tax=Acuticoccus sp. TaxID=1904378 RepID=UPI003B52ACA9
MTRRIRSLAIAFAASMAMTGPALAGGPGPDLELDLGPATDGFERSWRFKDTARIDLELEGEVRLRARARTDEDDLGYTDRPHRYDDDGRYLAPSFDAPSFDEDERYLRPRRRLELSEPVYHADRFDRPRYGRQGRGRVKIVERPCSTRIVQRTPRGKVVRVIRHCEPRFGRAHRGVGVHYGHRRYGY